jgi:hypothetical protein
VGAEGSIVVMRRSLWDWRTDRNPGEMGFYTGRILGVDAVWDYCGENTGYEMRTEMFPADEEEREIVAWFRRAGEEHEVWT